MNRRLITRRSLTHYWRTNLGVMLGAAVACAILVGALVVGDSVRASVEHLTLARIGSVTHAMHAPGRLFRAALADDMQGAGFKTPALLLAANASSPDRGARANGVQVVGVRDDFWQLAMQPHDPALGEGEVALNDTLADQLGVGVGDAVLLRIDKPSALPRDAPLASTDDATAAVRMTVKAVLNDERFGRFGLTPTQRPPYNAFVNLDRLSRAVEQPDRANTILSTAAGSPDQALAGAMRLADLQLETRVVSTGKTELRSDRVFIDPPIAEVVPHSATRVVTYFVNELSGGKRNTPYSVVAATDAAPMPAGAPDDAVVITDWLAKDMQVTVGDRITIRFWVLGPMRSLVEKSADFKVVKVIAQRDTRYFMPQLPGLSDAEHCRDWKPGFDIDLSRILDQDEEFWDTYRGSPKAYIKLARGKELWGNRFGAYTSFFFDGPIDAQALVDSLDPAALGMAFQPVRDRALAAAGTGTASYFGYLFIGFSFFLIVAAALLTGMLYTFNVESRSTQIGTLLAVGYTPGQVRSLLLGEGATLALIGTAVGVVGGLAYTKAVLVGLTTIWVDAVGLTSVQFAVGAPSVAGGAIASLLVAVASVWLAVRRRARIPAARLLASLGGEVQHQAVTLTGPLIASGLFGLCAAGALAAVAVTHGAAQAGAFFGAGAALLALAVSLVTVLLRRVGGRHLGVIATLPQLGRRSAARRRGRSVGVVTLLALGVFLVVAVGANRKNASINADRRDSGTGGYALVGTSALPVFDALEAEDAPAFDAVPLRLGAGDDASCLNLTRAQKPRLLAVDGDRLAGRFSFVQTHEPVAEGASPWQLLRDAKVEPGVVPAIADQPTLQWGLQMKLGDTIRYTDQRGQPFDVQVVGVVASSVLQGNIIIDERAYLAKYPDASGYGMFLIDATDAGAVSKALSRRYEDAGLELVPAATRLARFLAVENTYLSIFLMLGALGVMVGTAGLGVVVARNILERRGELALLRSVGFSAGQVRRLIVWEHAWLLLIGVASGVIAALVAVTPALGSAGDQLPVVNIALAMVGIVLCGLAFIVVATAAALRGPLLESLRAE